MYLPIPINPLNDPDEPFLKAAATQLLENDHKSLWIGSNNEFRASCFSQPIFCFGRKTQEKRMHAQVERVLTIMIRHLEQDVPVWFIDSEFGGRAATYTQIASSIESSSRFGDDVRLTGLAARVNALAAKVNLVDTTVEIEEYERIVLNARIKAVSRIGFQGQDVSRRDHYDRTTQVALTADVAWKLYCVDKHLPQIQEIQQGVFARVFRPVSSFPRLQQLLV